MNDHSRNQEYVYAILFFPFQKISFLVALLIVVGVTMMCVPNAHVAQEFCVWTGNGTTNNWSDAGNWSSCHSNIPEDGDVLNFDDVANRKTNTNDIVWLEVARIDVGCSNYTISGNEVTITSQEGNTLLIPGTNNLLSFDVAMNVNISSQIVFMGQMKLHRT